MRPYGQGRVFYCSLGHEDATYCNKTVLKHFLAGIQYALGDLKAGDAAPDRRHGAISNAKRKRGSSTGLRFAL